MSAEWPETLVVLAIGVIAVAVLTSAVEGVRVRVRYGTSTVRPWWWRTYLRRAVRSPWERHEPTEWESIPSSGKRWKVERS